MKYLKFVRIKKSDWPIALELMADAYSSSGYDNYLTKKHGSLFNKRSFKTDSFVLYAKDVVKTRIAFFACVEGKSIGFVVLEKTNSGFVLECFYITRSFQGKGIGTLLLRYCLKDMPPNTTISLEVFDHVAHVINLYSEWGFIETGVSRLIHWEGWPNEANLYAKTMTTTVGALRQKFPKPSGWTTQLFAENIKKEVIISDCISPVESSSTIKVPILLRSVGLSRSPLVKFDIRDEHDSNGSGVLAWRTVSRLRHMSLIRYVVDYSDCVASNVLTDYVGGESALNQWLASEGYTNTRLLLHPMNFAANIDGMPAVGLTSAEEITKLYSELLLSTPLSFRIALLLYSVKIDTCWYWHSLPRRIRLGLILFHKTGSMIDCDKLGRTVYNSVGIMTNLRSTVSFATLNQIQLVISPGIKIDQSCAEMLLASDAYWRIKQLI